MRSLAERRSFALGRLIHAIRLFGDAGQSLRHAARPQLPLELAFVEATLAELPQGDDGRPTRETQARVEARASDVPAATALPAGTAPDAAGRVAPVAPVPHAVQEDSASLDVQPPATPSVSPATPFASAERAPEASDSGEPPATPDALPDAPESVEAAPALNLDWVRGNWQLILMKTRPRSSQVRALLNSAFPIAVKGGTIVLGCEASFHREKLDEDKRKGLLEEVCSEVLHTPVRIECRVQGDVRDLMRVDETPQAPTDVFEAGQSAEDLRSELLNHPTVRALQERGGRVTKISLYDEEETGG
jgi:hypothetical protein